MLYDYLFLFSVLFEVVLSSVSEITHLRGLSLAQLPLYPKGRPFRCLDGSKVIPYSQVNDDYCDCVDASDEPGTSACVSGHFHCSQIGFTPVDIPSSRVNDGICDCCDGADEYTGMMDCPNTCAELGAKARVERERLAAVVKQGYDIKQTYISDAESTLAEKRKRVADLEAEKLVAQTEKDSLEARKEELEIPEKEAKEQHEKEWEVKKTEILELRDKENAQEAFAQLDLNSDNLVSIDEMQTHPEFDVDQNGEVSVEEAQEYLEGNSAIPIEKFTDEVWKNIKQIYKSPKLTEESAPEVSISSETSSTATASKPSEEETDEEYKYDDDDDEELDGLSKQDDDDDTDLESEIMRSSTTQSPASTASEDDDLKMPPYPEETMTLIQEADDARRAFDAANTKLTDIDTEIDKLKGELAADYGPQNEFFPLRGQCFEFDDREYKYRLCPFDRTTQEPKHGGHETRLGSFEGFVGPEPAAKYSKMRFSHGEGCWNGPDRSTVVQLECGADNQLVSASEPNRCEYAMRFTTPAVCPHPDSVASATDLPVSEHDEL